MESFKNSNESIVMSVVYLYLEYTNRLFYCILERILLERQLQGQ